MYSFFEDMSPLQLSQICLVIFLRYVVFFSDILSFFQIHMFSFSQIHRLFLRYFDVFLEYVAAFLKDDVVFLRCRRFPDVKHDCWLVFV